jgi:hypothetical protein
VNRARAAGRLAPRTWGFRRAPPSGVAECDGWRTTHPAHDEQSVRGGQGAAAPRPAADWSRLAPLGLPAADAHVRQEIEGRMGLSRDALRVRTPKAPPPREAPVTDPAPDAATTA